MLHIDQVSKSYGKVLANDHVSLEVPAGELAVLLGPNGAGKSTLIKCVCGLLRFDGSITVNGLDNRSEEAKRMMGYIPEYPALYPMLTVHEHLEFIARAYKLSDWKGYADELLARFELDDKQNKLGKELSKGMQQKVSICCALLPRPYVVILDEPLVGLDPHAIRELKKLVLELKDQGSALLMSTHMIESVERGWDMTYIMMESRIAAMFDRDQMERGENLEELYFSITEGANHA